MCSSEKKLYKQKKVGENVKAVSSDGNPEGAEALIVSRLALIHTHTNAEMASGSCQCSLTAQAHQRAEGLAWQNAKVTLSWGCGSRKKAGLTAELLSKWMSQCYIPTVISPNAVKEHISSKL